MTKEEFYNHIRKNVKNEYSTMVVIAALYKKIYGEYPKIGMSGQQAEFVDELLSKLPELTGNERKLPWAWLNERKLPFDTGPLPEQEWMNAPMGKPDNVIQFNPAKQSDKAYLCECGSVKWCLRADYKLECYHCGSVISDVEWKETKAKPTDEELAQKYLDRCADEDIMYMEHIERFKEILSQLITEARS